MLDMSEDTYTVTVSCENCRAEGEKIMTRGVRVAEATCENCGIEGTLAVVRIVQTQPLPEPPQPTSEVGEDGPQPLSESPGDAGEVGDGQG